MGSPARHPSWIRRALRALSPARLAAAASPVTGLHECPDCRRDRVWPVRWHPVDDERWSITLRCGECALEREVIATNAEAADYDGVLDTQIRDMKRAAERLDAEHMAAQVDIFVAALGRDLIDAADF